MKEYKGDKVGRYSSQKFKCQKCGLIIQGQKPGARCPRCGWNNRPMFQSCAWCGAAVSVPGQNLCMSCRCVNGDLKWDYHKHHQRMKDDYRKIARKVA
jgi:hypothetical protein